MNYINTSEKSDNDTIYVNYKNAQIPTTVDMIDMKGPLCYTGPQKTDDIVKALQTQQQERLAQTVNERATKEEGLFIGHNTED